MLYCINSHCFCWLPSCLLGVCCIPIRWTMPGEPMVLMQSLHRYKWEQTAYQLGSHGVLTLFNRVSGVVLFTRSESIINNIFEWFSNVFDGNVMIPGFCSFCLVVIEPVWKHGSPSCRQRKNKKFTYHLHYRGTCGYVYISLLDSNLQLLISSPILR